MLECGTAAIIKAFGLSVSVFKKIQNFKLVTIDETRGQSRNKTAIDNNNSSCRIANCCVNRLTIRCHYVGAC